MTANFTHSTPLEPGQRVAVFPFDEASGATLGYYGDIIAVFHESKVTFPRSPEWWKYHVYVPAVRHEMVVWARDIVAFGQTVRPEEAQNALEVHSIPRWSTTLRSCAASIDIEVVRGVLSSFANGRRHIQRINYACRSVAQRRFVTAR